LLVNNMFYRFWCGKLRNSLLVVFLILTLTVAFVAVLADYHYTGRRITEYALENLSNLCRTQSKYIESWYLEKTGFICCLAGREEIKTLEPAEIKPLLARAAKNHAEFLNLAVTDKKGVVIASLTPLSVNLDEKTYLNAAQSSTGYVSEVLYCNELQRPVTVIASPVKKQGRASGMLVGTIDLGLFNEVMEAGRFGKTGESFLVDREGLIIAGSRLAAEHEGGDVAASKALTDLNLSPEDVDNKQINEVPSEFGRYQDYRGVEVLGVYQWLDPVNLGIVVKKDFSEIREESGSAARSGFAAAVIATGILLPFIFILSGKLSRPLEELARTADQIAAGDYGVTVNAYSNFELNSLAASFNKMSRKLKQNHEGQMKQIAVLKEKKQELAMQNEELIDAVNRLEVLAVTDPLTGAYNRRYIISEIKKELAASVRHGLPLSVIMVDIDHYKNINDRHGHQVGDDVLREFVQVLSGCIRTSDVLGRYGGEEFIVISPFTKLQEAIRLAERLRETVNKWPFETTYGFLKFTISLGAASFDGDAGVCDLNDEFLEDILVDRLLAQADAEMYKAKAQGRNRVSPSLSEPETGNGE